MNRKIVIGVGIIGIMFLFLLFQNFGDDKQLFIENEFYELDSVAEQKIYKATHYMKPVRADLPAIMYKYIEDMPDDFYEKRHKFRYPKYQEDMEICNLGSEYYNQPEWFLGFEELAVPVINKAEMGRHGINPVPSIYPSDQIIQIQPGNSIDLCTLLRTSYLTELYIGMQPKIIYRENIEIKPNHYGVAGLKLDNLSSKDSQKYIDVKITPDEFYLRPSYPVFGGVTYNDKWNCRLFGCEENIWTKKLKLAISIDKETPKGYYMIGLDFVPPSVDNNYKWDRFFGLSYKTLGGIVIQFERPVYQLLIKVI